MSKVTKFHPFPMFRLTASDPFRPSVAQDEEKLTPHGHAMARC